MIGNFSIRCLSVAQILQGRMDFLLHDIVHQRDSFFLHKQLREIISGYTQLVRQLYNGNLLTKPLSHLFLASGYQGIFLHSADMVPNKSGIVRLRLSRQSNHFICMQKLFYLQDIGVG